MLLSAAPADAKPLTIGFSSLSQRQALAKKELRLRVRSRSAGRVRLFVATGHSIVLTRTGTLKLEARRSRGVSLTLTRAGERELTTCVKRRFVANVVPVKGVAKGTGKAVRFWRAMKRDRTQCKKSPSGGGTGGGGPPGPQQHPSGFQTPSDASRCAL